MSPFLFNGSELPNSSAIVAEVPEGLATKDALLNSLGDCLHFPDYFGGNWDALWECIRDLSWLPGGTVVLRHRDVPLTGDVAGQKKYLSILRDTVEKKWVTPGQTLRQLVVVFPAETHDQVAWLLRTLEHDENSAA